MKNKFLLFLVLVICFASCRDESLTPVLTFDKATIGAYPRLVALTTGEYDLDNISSSALVYEVDFVDEDLGNLVTEYVIEGQFVDNTEGNDVSRDLKEYRRISASEFGTSENGNKGLVVTIPLTEALEFWDLTEDEVNAGDQFSFSTTVIHEDGTSYSANNSSQTVRGSAFQGYFTYNGKLTCPLSNDEFSGNYNLSYIGDASGGFSIPFAEGTVEVQVIEGSSTRRFFNLPWAPDIGGFPGADFTFDFVCEFVVVEEFTAGANCGAPLTIVQGEPSSFDLSNDNEIILNIIEYDKDGGCGVSPQPKTIRLRKE